MAFLKLVQNVGRVAYSSGISTISAPFPLKSGYVRVSNGAQYVYVGLGTDITATNVDFGIPPNSVEILKERVSTQQIVGIITGTTTQIDSPQGTGQPFEIGDYVSISGASPVGINTNWARVTNIYRGFDRNFGGPAERMTINWNTSSVSGPIDLGGAVVRRSIKVALISETGSSFAHISEVQVAN